MHRSRLFVLAIFAAAAACSSNNDAEATSILSKDTALVATLDVRGATHQQPLPDACGTVAVAPQPAAANRTQAEALARQAYDAELVGHTRDAQALLSRAAKLDGTDKSAAYHLGRTSEALGDRAGATTAYCRYLTLSPTAAELADATQRVARLAQSGTRVAAGIVGSSAPTSRGPAVPVSRGTRGQPRVAQRVATRGPIGQSARTPSSERGMRSRSAATNGADDSPAASDPATGSVEVAGKGERATADGEVVEMPRPDAAPDQGSIRTESRGPSRMQTAGIGAIAGAIMGAAAGRSVKSAVIGAAAGGVLGTVVGGTTRPASRGVRPWATNVMQPAGGNRVVRLSNRAPSSSWPRS